MTIINRDPRVTSRIMSNVRSQDTEPELVLRRAVHSRGVRYRIHARDVLGRPDLVVRRKKVAVFVVGDFWHGNPAEWERRGRAGLAAMFPTRTEFWVAKIERNIQRDLRVSATLRASGWDVVRLWASDVLADPDRAADIVVTALGAAQ